MGKFVKNFEQEVYRLLKDDGFDVLKNGYPDFMVRRNGRYSGVAAIEVKQGNDKVRPNQKEMHDLFKDAGIPVYVIRPEDIYEKRNSLKFRFKKIIGFTHYKDMINRINNLFNRKSLEVESIILKEPIMDDVKVNDKEKVKEDDEKATSDPLMEDPVIKKFIIDLKNKNESK